MASTISIQHVAPESLGCCRAIVESCPDPVWVFDATGRLTWRNRHAVEAGGSAAPEGSNFLELMAPDALAPAEHVYDDALRGKASTATLRLRFGQTARVTTTPITEDGHSHGFVCVTEDLTSELRRARELQARERELELLHVMAEAAANATDLTTLLERGLDAVLRITGLTPVGGVFVVDDRLRELRLVAHRGLPARFVEAEERLPIGECLCGLAAQSGQLIASNDSASDERHTRNWGVGGHSHVIVPLTAHGRVRGVMFLYPSPAYVLEDDARELFVTVGKQLGMAIEAVLAQKVSRSELKRRVAELEGHLRHATKPDRDLDRAAGDFLAMVSHDLRTPLSGIMAHASLLSRRGKKHAARWCMDSADAILRVGRRMDDMISDLGDSARLASGHIDLDRRALHASTVIEEVLEVLPADGRSRIVVDCAPELPMLEADLGRLSRALLNVVSNALKYSPAEKPVRIAVSATNDGLTFSVQDHGVGIDPEKLGHVFERFYRADETTGSHGLGLGLYIARLLVEAHRGSISATSVPGEQSTFEITVPLRAERRD